MNPPQRSLRRILAIIVAVIAVAVMLGAAPADSAPAAPVAVFAPAAPAADPPPGTVYILPPNTPAIAGMTAYGETCAVVVEYGKAPAYNVTYYKMTNFSPDCWIFGQDDMSIKGTGTLYPVGNRSVVCKPTLNGVAGCTFHATDAQATTNIAVTPYALEVVLCNYVASNGTTNCAIRRFSAFGNTPL